MDKRLLCTVMGPCSDLYDQGLEYIDGRIGYLSLFLVYIQLT